MIHKICVNCNAGETILHSVHNHWIEKYIRVPVEIMQYYKNIGNIYCYGLTTITPIFL